MLNNVQDKCRFIKADVFDYLRWEAKKGKKYDFIVVDPPAFVKSRQEKKDAIEGYVNLNRMALKLLRKNGILATSSCSQHISETDFLEIIKRRLKLLKKQEYFCIKEHKAKTTRFFLQCPRHPT